MMNGKMSIFQGKSIVNKRCTIIFYDKPIKLHFPRKLNKAAERLLALIHSSPEVASPAQDNRAI